MDCQISQFLPFYLVLASNQDRFTRQSADKIISLQRSLLIIALNCNILVSARQCRAQLPQPLIILMFIFRLRYVINDLEDQLQYLIENVFRNSFR